MVCKECKQQKEPASTYHDQICIECLESKQVDADFEQDTA